MRIIVLSGSPLSLPVLNDLHQQNYLSALICPEDMIATEVEPLQTWAAGKGVPCWQTEPNTMTTELEELVRETDPHLLIVFGFPYTLSPELLQRMPLGAWNIHFSLQPENRGTITIHQLVRGLGEQLLQQQNIALSAETEAGTALQQLSIVVTALLHDTLMKIQPPKKKKTFSTYIDCLL